MTLLLACVLGFLLAFGWEHFCTHIIKKTSLIVQGWRFHHSLYGLLFLTFGFLIPNNILLGIGIGIIVQHTMTDGFRFISKERI